MTRPIKSDSQAERRRAEQEARRRQEAEARQREQAKREAAERLAQAVGRWGR